MAPYRIEVKTSAAKYIEKQDPKTRRLLREKIEKIASNPLDIQHSKELVGRSPLRSARVGGLRIIFEANQQQRLLTILIVDSRGQVYKRF